MRWPQTSLYSIPFGGVDQSRHQIEREDAFFPSFVAVDVERDAHVHQVPLGGLLAARQVPFRQGVNAFDDESKLVSWVGVGTKEFVVEAFGLVGVELHRPFP